MFPPLPRLDVASVSGREEAKDAGSEDGGKNLLPPEDALLASPQEAATVPLTAFFLSAKPASSWTEAMDLPISYGGLKVEDSHQRQNRAESLDQLDHLVDQIRGAVREGHWGGKELHPVDGDAVTPDSVAAWLTDAETLGNTYSSPLEFQPQMADAAARINNNVYARAQQMLLFGKES